MIFQDARHRTPATRAASRHIDLATGVTEASMARILSGAFPSDVHPMSPPLAFHPVWRVGHANGTALVEGSTARPNTASLAAGAFPCGTLSPARNG
jgi:hypothetical protein